MSAKVIQIPTKVWHLLTKAAILFAVCLLIGVMINFVSPRVTLTMGPEEQFWFWIYLCLIGGGGTFLCECVLSYLGLKWSGISIAFAKSICGTVFVLIPLHMFYDPAEIPNFSTTFIFVWMVMVLILIGTFIFSLKLFPSKNEPSLSPRMPGASPLIVEADVETPHHTIEVPEDFTEVPTRILERLPIHLQSSELYAVSSEDHYVRVHTSKGDDMILMRLSDAMLETGNVEGLQIHRSWWVAKEAIANIKATGRTAEVTLKNDVKAPVSRNMVKTLRTMGWL